MSRALVSAVILLGTAVPASAQSGFDAYLPGSLIEISARIERDLFPQADTTSPGVILAQADFPTRASLTFMGQWRPLSGDAETVLRDWAEAFGVNPAVLASFDEEALFLEGAAEFWIPVQNALKPRMLADLPAGSAVTLLTMWIGGRHRGANLRSIFLGNEFVAPGMSRMIDLGNAGRIYLGVELYQRDEILGPPSDGLYPLRPGTFGGAEQVYVELTGTGEVEAIHFAYEPGTNYEEYLSNATQALGPPTESSPDRSVWIETISIAELERQTLGGVSRVHFRLIDRRLAGR